MKTTDAKLRPYPVSVSPPSFRGRTGEPFLLTFRNRNTNRALSRGLTYRFTQHRSVAKVILIARRLRALPIGLTEIVVPVVMLHRAIVISASSGRLILSSRV